MRRHLPYLQHPMQNYGIRRGGDPFHVNMPGVGTRPRPGGLPVTDQGPGRLPDPNQLGGGPQRGNDAGRDPMQHMRWWASQGYTYNPQADRFRQAPNALQNYLGGAQNSPHQAAMGYGPPTTDQGPGGGEGRGGGRRRTGNPVTDHGPGGAGHQGGGNPNLGGHGPVKGHRGNNRGGGQGDHGNGGGNGQGGGARRYGLPLDATFEAQRRGLSDQLQGALQPLGAERDQILANQQLQQARLGTNQDVQNRALLEQMASRGIFGSGIQAHDQGQVATDFLRQFQDLGNQTAAGLGGVAATRADAQAAYQRGLMEALLSLARRSAADQYTPARGGAL